DAAPGQPEQQRPQLGKLLAAGVAPGGPEVQEHRLAAAQLGGQLGRVGGGPHGQRRDGEQQRGEGGRHSISISSNRSRRGSSGALRPGQARSEARPSPQAWQTPAAEKSCSPGASGRMGGGSGGGSRPRSRSRSRKIASSRSRTSASFGSTVLAL